MFAYISLQIFVFYEIDLWGFFLTKDTVIWILGVASLLLVNISEINTDHNYFKKLLFNNFKFVLILEFIANLYSFSFVVEMILVPFVSFVVMMEVFSKNKTEYSSVNKIANVVLAAIGIVVLIISVSKIIN